MAIIDRIKFDGPEDGSPWLVYKYPSEQFVLGSQLIVSAGQEVLFLKGGEALDTFGPGTHTLKTGNLPILNKLVNLPFGGSTPFTAEVYYINKTARLDMGWGTGSPFDMEDPRYGVPLQITAYGQYGVSIPDSRLFVVRLVGAVPLGSLTEYSYVGKFFNGHINTRLKSMLARAMTRDQISFLDISAHLDMLSGEAQTAIANEFERFGVEIVNFFIESVKPKDTPELEEIKRKRTEISGKRMELDELGRDFYAQRRSFDVMEKMAGNPGSGGLAAAGMGMGMGLGAGGAMGQALGGIAGNINPMAQQAPQPMAAPAGAPGIQCTNCAAIIPAGMKFCGGCGTPAPVNKFCTSCGAQAQPGMKFCGGCGAQL